MENIEYVCNDVLGGLLRHVISKTNNPNEIISKEGYRVTGNVIHSGGNHETSDTGHRAVLYHAFYLC